MCTSSREWAPPVDKLWIFWNVHWFWYSPSCPFWEQLTNSLAWLWEWLWTKANLDWSETQWCLEPYLQSVGRCVHRVAILESWIPYSGKFSLVQIFTEKRPDSSEEIFAVFIFADAGRSGHTPTSWWPRLICETALNDEAKKQACATTA